ncbi:hypothetical protein MAR_014871, partial [Mya arenaria]
MNKNEQKRLRQCMPDWNRTIDPMDIIIDLPCLSETDRKKQGFREFVLALRRHRHNSQAEKLDPGHDIQEEDASSSLAANSPQDIPVGASSGTSSTSILCTINEQDKHLGNSNLKSRNETVSNADMKSKKIVKDISPYSADKITEPNIGSLGNAETKHYLNMSDTLTANLFAEDSDSDNDKETNNDTDGSRNSTKESNLGPSDRNVRHLKPDEIRFNLNIDTVDSVDIQREEMLYNSNKQQMMLLKDSSTSEMKPNLTGSFDTGDNFVSQGKLPCDAPPCQREIFHDYETLKEKSSCSRDDMKQNVQTVLNGPQSTSRELQLKRHELRTQVLQDTIKNESGYKDVRSAIFLSASTTGDLSSTVLSKSDTARDFDQKAVQNSKEETFQKQEVVDAIAGVPCNIGKEHTRQTREKHSYKAYVDHSLEDRRIPVPKHIDSDDEIDSIREKGKNKRWPGIDASCKTKNSAFNDHDSVSWSSEELSVSTSTQFENKLTESHDNVSEQPRGVTGQSEDESFINDYQNTRGDATEVKEKELPLNYEQQSGVIEQSVNECNIINYPSLGLDAAQPEENGLSPGFDQTRDLTGQRGDKEFTNNTSSTGEQATQTKSNIMSPNVDQSRDLTKQMEDGQFTNNRSSTGEEAIQTESNVLFQNVDQSRDLTEQRENGQFTNNRSSTGEEAIQTESNFLFPNVDQSRNLTEQRENEQFTNNLSITGEETTQTEPNGVSPNLEHPRDVS